MRWNLKKELGRKLIHLCSIFFLLIYVSISSAFDEKIALFILAALLVTMIELEILRIEKGMSIPIINILWRYKRPSEKNRLGSEVYFLIGAIICLALFDIRIAAAAILMTTFGDLTAAIIGKRFARHWIKKDKAIEGMIAEFFIDILIGFIVIRTSLWKLAPLGISGQPIWPIIIIMASTATIVETLVRKIDDNLLIPVFSGFNGQLTLFILTYLNMI